MIKRGWTTVNMPIDVLIEATYDGPSDTAPSIRYIDHAHLNVKQLAIETESADDLDLSGLNGIEPTEEGRD